MTQKVFPEPGDVWRTRKGDLVTVLGPVKTPFGPKRIRVLDGGAGYLTDADGRANPDGETADDLVVRVFEALG